MIKLFAFDLDGTVLDQNSKLNNNTIASFKKLEENGIKSVIATGRVASSASYIIEKIAIDNPFVANNGAISFLDKNNILKATYLDMDILKELIDYANNKNLYFHFYDCSNFYAQSFYKERVKHLKVFEKDDDTYQVNLIIDENPLDILIKNKSKALKFQIYVDDNSQIDQESIINDLLSLFGQKLYITRSSDKLIEIMKSGVSKWQAILDIADKLGISKEEIAAIGDQDNDILMVKNSKLGFSMGNGIKQLKDIADFVVSSNKECGVCEAIDLVLEYNKKCLI